MSSPEREGTFEQRSSVKIEQNAKGDPAVKVAAYTHDLDGLDAAREKAVATYKATLAELAGGAS